MSMLVICCHGNAGIWSKKCRFRWVVKPAELVSAADISRSIRYGGELKDCFGSTLLFNVDVVGYLASYPSLFPCTYHVYHMSLHRSHRISVESQHLGGVFLYQKSIIHFPGFPFPIPHMKFWKINFMLLVQYGVRLCRGGSLRNDLGNRDPKLYGLKNIWMDFHIYKLFPGTNFLTAISSTHAYSSNKTFCLRLLWFFRLM